jgi:hypothetical protein
MYKFRNESLLAAQMSFRNSHKLSPLKWIPRPRHKVGPGQPKQPLSPWSLVGSLHSAPLAGVPAAGRISSALLFPPVDPSRCGTAVASPFQALTETTVKTAGLVPRQGGKALAHMGTKACANLFEIPR